MTDDKPFTCSNCGKPAKRLFKGTLCRSCATPTWKCRECGREYKYYTEIGKCRRCRANGQTFTCGTCGREFQTKKGLMQHEESHSESFVCPDCGLECGTPQAYGSHMAYHDPAKVEQKNAKTRETCLERYGVTAPWSSRQAIEKAKRTKIERYGYYAYFQKPGAMRDVVRKAWTTEARAKRDATNIERYGASVPTKSEIVTAKKNATTIERYGGTSPMSSPVVRAKSRETSLRKYGVPFPTMSPVVKMKIRESQMDVFGDWAFHTPKSIKKMRRSIARQTGGFTDTQLDEAMTVDGLTKVIDGFDHKPSLQEVAWSIGVSVKIVRRSLEMFGMTELVNLDANLSESNRMWKGILSAEGFSIEPEQYVYGDYRRCDFLIGGTIALEVNPTYTHASYGRRLFVDHLKEREVRPTYHRDKSIAALRNGYQPLCVWDWDDPQDIVSLIRSTLDGTYETNPEYIPLDRPVVGIPVDDLDLDSVEPNLVWCDRNGEVADDVSDHVYENVAAGLFGIYDCGVARLRG